MRWPACASCGKPATVAVVLPYPTRPERVVFACTGRHAPARLELGADWRDAPRRLRRDGYSLAAELLAAAVREQGEAVA